VNPRVANPVHEEGCLYAPMLAPAERRAFTAAAQPCGACRCRPRRRRQYLAARRGAGVRDFGVFNFRFANASPQVVTDVLRAVATFV
jgi:hypothetical protein